MCVSVYSALEQEHLLANCCSSCFLTLLIPLLGFLDTLYDTLCFTPKVDFNAGVVAAGEAQIESTVCAQCIMHALCAHGISEKRQGRKNWVE